MPKAMKNLHNRDWSLKNCFCNTNNALLRNKKDYCDDYIPFFVVKFDNKGKGSMEK